MNKDGHVYSFDVHAVDGRDSAWVSPCEIELDLTAPNAPRVSSRVYPEGTGQGERKLLSAIEFFGGS